MMLAVRRVQGFSVIRKCCRLLSDNKEGVDVTSVHDNKTVVVTMRNEGKMNCMTEKIARDFQGIVNGLSESHPHARCLVVTGHGNSFAAGADLAWLEERGRTEEAKNVEIMKEYYGFFTPLLRSPLPTIAAINGPAMGAGFCVAMFCDLRLTSHDAKLGANFLRLGINPGMGGSFTIPAKLSNQVANNVILTGRTFTGKEAEEMGVVVKAVASKAEVLPESLRLAQEIVSKTSPIAMRETLQLLRSSQTEQLEAQLEREALAQARCFAAADYQRALAAIRAKKPPVF